MCVVSEKRSEDLESPCTDSCTCVALESRSESGSLSSVPALLSCTSSKVNTQLHVLMEKQHFMDF